MGISRLLKQQTSSTQVFHDKWIGILDKLATPRRHFGDKRTIRKYSHQHRKIMFPCHVHIFRAEGRGDMDESCPIFGRHKIARYNEMRGSIWRHERKERMILRPIESLAFESIDNFHFFIAKDFPNE